LLHPRTRCSDSRVVSAFLLIAAFIVLAIAAAYLSSYFKRKRREALAFMARQLGWSTHRRTRWMPELPLRSP
jgi:transposase